MNKIRVLIVDDHAIVRAGLRLLLETQADTQVMGEASSGEEALAKVEELHPDVVLMDLTMSGMGGLEAIRRIKREHQEVQVLALTMHENERYFFEALQAGASGYVVKGASPAELLAALRAVHRGHAYLYPSLARKFLDDYLQRVARGEERQSYDGLTSREREVLKLIAEGRTSREIAEELYLSVNTVDRHRANIMDKLNMHSRAELIRYALRKGLVSLEEE